MISYKIKKIIAEIYRWLYNPHKLNLPTGNCPVQCEGYLPTGEFYYFKSRWSSWSLDVTKDENSWNLNDFLFIYEEKDFCKSPDAGWISQLKAYILLNKGIKKYLNEKKKGYI